MDVAFPAQQGGVGLWLPFPGRTDKHKLPVGVGPGHRRHQRKIEFVAADRPDEADARPGNRRQILRQRLRREGDGLGEMGLVGHVGIKADPPAPGLQLPLELG